MTQLVILVVIAAWLAVLIPPMLRSRVENRPNSSVTDFRRQLDRLQTTAVARPSARALGRPLAPSGLGRSGRVARPEKPMLRSGVVAPQPASPRVDPYAEPQVDEFEYVEDRPAPREPARTGGGKYRSHGDPTGGQRRPAADRSEPMARPAPRPTQPPARREHTAPHGMGRPVDVVRRRRANVLFLLLALTGSTLFLAATTGSSVMFYAFALSFLAFVGYIYLLAQANQRGAASYDGWLDR